MKRDTLSPDESSHVTDRGCAIARRQFFGDCGVGIGKIALGSLLAGEVLGRQPDNPLAAKSPHFKPTVKSVIHLFMAGAPSQLELFDEKPTLTRLEGKPLPESVIGDQRYAFIQPNAGVLGPQTKFGIHGSSGQIISEVLPHLPKIADEICILRGVHTDQFNHAPAQIFFNSGFGQPGRPSFGSWVTYGLGSMTKELPSFVVMNTGGGLSGGAALWSSGFLPTVYTGVMFRKQGAPILNVESPEGVSEKAQRESIAFIKRLNQRKLQQLNDPEIETRIASYEMAARLQLSAPELMDLSTETKETIALYGCEPEQASFSRSCLLARRMVERGVRYISLYRSGWDAHSNVLGNVKSGAADTDQAVTALILDLKRRDMLDETLVIWGGEFGRTPMVETNPTLSRTKGRDHHPQAFTLWMAGGGIKKGHSIGQTDDFGFHPVQDGTHVHDIQATILQQLGLDHERLTYHHAGRDFRLTDVSGSVIEKILV
tara:strand:+ start:169 stop:1626 length:1458 start_codon:yes stop_codon:yes gene_type:complete